MASTVVKMEVKRFSSEVFGRRVDRRAFQDSPHGVSVEVVLVASNIFGLMRTEEEERAKEEKVKLISYFEMFPAF